MGAWIGGSACHASLDREDKVKTMAAEVLEMEPKFSSSDFVEALPYRDEPDRAHHRDALIKAGLPE